MFAVWFGKHDFHETLDDLVDQSKVSFCDSLFTSFLESIKGGTN